MCATSLVANFGSASTSSRVGFHQTKSQHWGIEDDLMALLKKKKEIVVQGGPHSVYDYFVFCTDMQLRFL